MYNYKYFVLLLSLKVIEGRFRCDYKYSEVANGWFKHHIMPATWGDARLRCMMEGAELAIPTTSEMKTEMKRIIANKKKIFTGIHATFSQGDFYTIVGTPLSQFQLHWSKNEAYNKDNKESCITFNDLGEIGDSNCFDVLPYLCYRSANIETEANECGTVDPEYILDRRTKKCYKFHTVPRNFSRAFLSCSAEGGHLAIINSETEHTVLKEIFTKFPKANMNGDMEKDNAYIGVHTWDEKYDWRTIHGQALWEAGFSQFKSGQPDDAAPGQNCGALHRLGQLCDYYCEGIPAPFICEKDPNVPKLCEVPRSKRSRKEQLKPKQSQLQTKKSKLKIKNK